MSQDYTKRLFYPVLLLPVCLLAYLPISSFLFAPKNDAYIYNFPNKFFFSQCLRNGVLPDWNPYLNFGFPLHADPGFAWWHPVTWIFGLIGYNAYTFSVEILLYIYIGGLGMYWLGRVLHKQYKTAFSMACMFMCSGFFIGNLQHVNFLTGAAFLPWLVGSWWLYQKMQTTRHLLYSGSSAYLLFTAGHPAIPIATVYFLIVLTGLYAYYHREQIKLTPFIGNQVKLLLVTLVFLFPLMVSYLSIWPNYSRSEAVNQLASSNVGFTLPSFISILFPFATIKNTEWFSTDVSMRNAYFSLLGLFCFLYFLFSKQKEKRPYVFLLAGIFMLLLSAGGIGKAVIYNHLPGLQLIRTNGEFRVFSIFCFIVCSADPFDQLFSGCKNITLFTKRALGWFALLLLASIIVFSIYTTTPQLSQATTSVAENIKLFLEQITFSQSFLIALLAALLLSVAYWISVRKKKAAHFLPIVLIIDLLINSWLLLPITGVGKTSVATMQSVINKSPEGFPIPKLNKMPEMGAGSITPFEEHLIGNWAWYDKQIMHASIDYPSQLKNTVQLLSSEDSVYMLDKPFLFLKHQNTQGLHIESYSPVTLALKVRLARADTLVFLQNNFKGWSISVDQHPAKRATYLNTFMATPLPKGAHNIVWSYTSPVFRMLFFWGLLLAAGSGFYIGAIKIMKRKAS